jgi:hypothetical protein
MMLMPLQVDRSSYDSPCFGRQCSHSLNVTRCLTDEFIKAVPLLPERYYSDCAVFLTPFDFSILLSYTSLLSRERSISISIPLPLHSVHSRPLDTHTHFESISSAARDICTRLQSRRRTYFYIFYLAVRGPHSSKWLRNQVC